ncbi:MAG: membrane protein insertase YidC [Deltaproteobacteria bacterium]|jgi:YidC/Oxa1 family membrane protein insertase|nr:membrane protein insertase YidC [Deltaproteobacteria bacterium]
MEQSRLFLAIVLSLIIFLAYQFFFAPQSPQQQPVKKDEAPAATQEQPVQDKDQAQPSVADSKSTDVSPQPAADVEAPSIARTITVKTPLYEAKISADGAVIYSFLLTQYREYVKKDSPLKQVLIGEEGLGVGHLGFVGKSVAGLDKAVFSTDLPGDQLVVDESPQNLTFLWRSPQGVVIQKTFHFDAASYVVGLDVTVKNGSGRSIQDRLAIDLNGRTPADKRMYSFQGPSALINDELQQVEIKKIEDQNSFDGKIKWIAIQSRYFMSGLIPDEIEEARLQLSLNSDKFVAAQYQQPENVIADGNQHTFKYRLFIGPKKISYLKSVGNNLEKLVDFGWFDFIARPCLWLLNLFYSVIPNYGVAIIILTILVKILLWPLGQKSYKSMSEMKKLQPLMKEIREKHKDDKQRMNQEVMSLYKTYKINPLGGCLPMIVQLPVFFALYRMLYQAIELRHAPFFLWINDLSAPDRLFNFNFSIPFMEPPYGIPVLTVIMGASMLLQQKMSPPMGDATQAKMMMFMPIIFTFIFINFSSGLVLYWLVNNILSIAQQYYTQKKYA